MASVAPLTQPPDGAGQQRFERTDLEMGPPGGPPPGSSAGGPAPDPGGPGGPGGGGGPGNGDAGDAGAEGGGNGGNGGNGNGGRGGRNRDGTYRFLGLVPPAEKVCFGCCTLAQAVLLNVIGN